MRSDLLRRVAVPGEKALGRHHRHKAPVMYYSASQQVVATPRWGGKTILPSRFEPEDSQYSVPHRLRCKNYTLELFSRVGGWVSLRPININIEMLCF